jgi:hypothetical protein
MTIDPPPVRFPRDRRKRIAYFALAPQTPPLPCCAHPSGITLASFTPQNVLKQTLSIKLPGKWPAQGFRTRTKLWRGRSFIEQTREE